MSSSEITKLETRWRENPQGLTFAPLAEAYRKLREPGRALEVLAEGLSRHPDYIPASIVLGRCHLDLEQRPEAEAAFRRVLELDDENAIALRALADLAEADGRLAEAAGRLQELLAVDRSNDEARAQLARIESAIADGSIVVSGDEAGAPDDAGAHDWTPEPPAAEPVAGSVAIDAGDLMLEDNLHPAEAVEPLPDLVVDDVPAISSDAVDVPPLGDLVGKEFREVGAAVEPLSELSTGPDSLRPAAGFGGDEEDAAEFEVSEPLELDGGFERASDIELRPAERSEFQVESATDEWMIGRAEGDDEAAEGSGAFDPAFMDMHPGASEPEFIVDGDARSAPVQDEPAPVEELEPELEPEGAPALSEDESDPELVVTETMAELYLRQGHRSEALRVYRELWLRNRDDLRLRERVDSLETELAAEESGSGDEAGSFAAPAPARSVAAFLGSILSARPSGAPAVWSGESAGAQPLSGHEQADSPDAAPTRPAADHLSLSAIFGETGSPVPPAVAAGAPADEDGMSFDAFFGGDAPAGAARTRAASRDDDDLDQFHAWLQNLKR